MSHSENAHYQTKLETERDEVQPAFVAFGDIHRCFFDDHPATILLNGMYLCQSHATCNTCLKMLMEDGLTCRCDRYGYSGHEELLWCSESCKDAKHPEPDWDHQEK